MPLNLFPIDHVNDEYADNTIKPRFPYLFATFRQYENILMLLWYLESLALPPAYLLTQLLTHLLIQVFEGPCMESG